MQHLVHVDLNSQTVVMGEIKHFEALNQLLRKIIRLVRLEAVLHRLIGVRHQSSLPKELLESRQLMLLNRSMALWHTPINRSAQLAEQATTTKKN